MPNQLILRTDFIYLFFCLFVANLFFSHFIEIPAQDSDHDPIHTCHPLSTPVRIPPSKSWPDFPSAPTRDLAHQGRG